MVRRVLPSGLINGDRAAISQCTRWMKAAKGKLRNVNDAILQCLDAEELSSECCDRAFTWLASATNMLDEWLIEGLTGKLHCLDQNVYSHIGPYAAELLLVLDIVRNESRYSRSIVNKFADRWRMAASCFLRELEGVRQVLAMYNATSQQPPTVKGQNDARDRWLYQKCCSDVKYSAIANQLAKIAQSKGWEVIRDASSIKGAASRWAQRNGKPAIPKRQYGRKPK